MPKPPRDAQPAKKPADPATPEMTREQRRAARLKSAEFKRGKTKKARDDARADRVLNAQLARLHLYPPDPAPDPVPDPTVTP